MEFQIEAPCEDKTHAYRLARQDIEAALDNVVDPIVVMATVSAVLKARCAHFFWVGFYRMVEGRLLVGPYQGTPGCIEIMPDRGVCGACASRRQTIVVEDVDAFPGHIACDSQSRSEIVVPVFDQSERLRAVLDVDSTRKAAFDGIDQAELEGIALWMKNYVRW